MDKPKTNLAETEGQKRMLAMSIDMPKRKDTSFGDLFLYVLLGVLVFGVTANGLSACLAVLT